jgi:signal transduction histidine kinase
MIFNRVKWDLDQVIKMNIRLMQIRSEGKNIQIVSDISVGTFVYADKEMLDLIMRNLLSNAIKFTNHGGSIEIKAEYQEDKIIVAVRDTGEGIHSDQVHTLLHEDYPISTFGTAGERGVGLGLTLCREFVRLNGGEIWLDSVPGQGSTFYFSIPAPSDVFTPLIILSDGSSVG